MMNCWIEVRGLSGQPIHLDSVMSDEDKDVIGVIYPCVSRETGSTLVLDIQLRVYSKKLTHLDLYQPLVLYDFRNMNILSLHH
jgi:hypothetical protein